MVVSDFRLRRLTPLDLAVDTPVGVSLSNSVSMGRAERLLIEPLRTPVAIVDLISGDLAKVESVFREQLASPVRIVDEIGEEGVDAGVDLAAHHRRGVKEPEPRDAE